MTSIHVVCEGIVGLEVGKTPSAGSWSAGCCRTEARGSYVFREVDVARVRLIVELRRDLAIDDEAMPVVLGLLDQVYALRRRLGGIATALAALPPDLRAAIEARLNEAGFDPLADEGPAT